VDLEGDEAVVGDGGVGFGVGDGGFTVEGDRGLRAFAADLVAVPLAGFFEALDLFVGGAGEEVFATRFVAEATGVAGADVGLAAARFVPRLRDADAAEWHAAVDETSGADEAIPGAEDEILAALRRRQKFVTRVAVGGVADDRAVAHAPDAGGAVASWRDPGR